MPIPIVFSTLDNLSFRAVVIEGPGWLTITDFLKWLFESLFFVKTALVLAEPEVSLLEDSAPEDAPLPQNSKIFALSKSCRLVVINWLILFSSSWLVAVIWTNEGSAWPAKISIWSFSWSSDDDFFVKKHSLLLFHSLPSSYNSFFQIGTDALSSSIEIKKIQNSWNWFHGKTGYIFLRHFSYLWQIELPLRILFDEQSL